jgi:hypothetical protein
MTDPALIFHTQNATTEEVRNRKRREYPAALHAGYTAR